MNSFDFPRPQAQSEEYIRHDEEIARSAERRAQALENHWQYEQDNWIERTEFKPKPANYAHMQDELDFGEVA